MNVKEIKIKDFRYDLPAHRIPKYPLDQRDQSKLLVFDDDKIADRTFYELPNILPSNTWLIFNDSKVIPVRIHFENRNRQQIEIFCLESIQEEKQSAHWKCMIGNAAKWKEDSLKIETGNKELIAKKTEKKEDYFEVKFTWNSEVKNMLDALQVFGHIPIPPYFKRSTEAIDVIRYQNVFAHHDGSVAAPTAGLHFTKPLINQLEQNNVKIDYVTLHVGAGTFKPVKSETLGGHQMHREKMFLTKNLIHDLLRNTSDKKITAVGTTTLRTLESLFWMGQIIYNSPEIEEEKLVVPQWFPYEQQSVLKPIQSLQSILDWMTRNKTDTFAFSTELLILPSYQFKIAEALITNFHQPNSTLLLLVAAATNNKWQELYDHALQNDYRFLSYGDSSYIKF